MSAELTTELRGEPPRLRLQVAGEIDLSNVDRFRQSLAAGDGDGDGAGTVLVVDLDAVDYIDSAGIAALFERARRGRMEIVAGPRSVAAPLIRITRLGDVARVLPS